MKTITFKELVDTGTVICGSPATVRERLMEFVKDFRIGNLHAMPQFGSLPTELAKSNIELFAKEVMPHLRPVWEAEGTYTIGGRSGWGEFRQEKRYRLSRRGRVRYERIGRVSKHQGKSRQGANPVVLLIR